MNWCTPCRNASTGSVGDACDNAPAESIIGLFKTEVVNWHGPVKTLAEVEFALMEWADWYDNTRHADRRWSETEAGLKSVTVQVGVDGRPGRRP